jgi:hypothetical protein
MILSNFIFWSDSVRDGAPKNSDNSGLPFILIIIQYLKIFKINIIVFFQIQKFLNSRLGDPSQGNLGKVNIFYTVKLIPNSQSNP